MTMTISPIYIWVGVLTFCLVAEACTVQLGVCLVVAIVMLLLLRPVVRGKLLKTVDRTNADRILDQTAIVIQTIDAKQETGQIRLMGQIWSARAADPNDCIPEGETVVVTAISGVKAIVKRA